MKQQLLVLLSAIAAVFAPVQQVMVVTLVIMSIDLILGILAAKKRKEPISSAGLRRTITKFFIYETSICLGFLVQQYMLSDLIPIVKIISTFIGITELKSCMENMDDINGEPILKAIIEKLGSSNQRVDGQ